MCSGAIDLDEFERGLKKMDLGLGREQLVDLMNALDSDKDGCVALGESWHIWPTCAVSANVSLQWHCMCTIIAATGATSLRCCCVLNLAPRLASLSPNRVSTR